MKKILSVFLLLIVLFSTLTVTAFADDYFILSKQTNRYHRTTCSYLPGNSNRVKIDASDVYTTPGIAPCKHCNPQDYMPEKEVNGFLEYFKEQRYYDFKEYYVFIVPEIAKVALILSAIFLILSFIVYRLDVESEPIRIITYILAGISVTTLILSLLAIPIGEIVFFFKEMYMK